MKKAFLFFFCSSLFFSCENLDFPDATYGKIGNDKKQLVKILQDDKLWTELKYDTQNRIYQLIKYFDSGSDTTFLAYNANNQIAEVRRWKSVIDKYIYTDGKLTQMLSSNIQNPEYNVKIVYFYKNNRIDYANEYVNNKITSKILFGYDKKGNTISRKEYGVGSSQNNPNVEYNFTYDNKIIPFIDIAYQPLDIVQTNNAATTYFYALYMSSLPTVYGMNYEYDNDGFPISAKKYNTKYPDKILNTYTYIYK